ncbi:PTS sugar transporter subunit IIA [Fusibacter paucivorans]|uniref:PTS sugar transporter subunit IIA n=1 Tax=Fusibacter paucivorans TaxID=76009 RepID=A0ABS5PR12_9FIRM|nr:PTS sugar transporter subunit IIA [Fusibacter paucivorans]MBS7527604.1 PTS sugar transporter subunit IIA [Fusibacter paucivorans]
MQLGDLITENLILTEVNCVSKEEALKLLFDKLFNHGYVKDSFYQAILEREANYPTGLLLPKFNVAIPHVSPEYVNQSALAIAILKQPVPFHRMDDSDETVDVHVIFNIALADGGKQVEVLQAIMGLITNETLMAKVIAADSAAAVQKILSVGGEV